MGRLLLTLQRIGDLPRSITLRHCISLSICVHTSFLSLGFGHSCIIFSAYICASIRFIAIEQRSGRIVFSITKQTYSMWGIRETGLKAVAAGPLALAICILANERLTKLTKTSEVKLVVKMVVVADTEPSSSLAFVAGNQ